MRAVTGNDVHTVFSSGLLGVEIPPKNSQILPLNAETCNKLYDLKYKISPSNFAGSFPILLSYNKQLRLVSVVARQTRAPQSSVVTQD